MRVVERKTKNKNFQNLGELRRTQMPSRKSKPPVRESYGYNQNHFEVEY